MSAARIFYTELAARRRSLLRPRSAAATESSPRELSHVLFSLLSLSLSLSLSSSLSTLSLSLSLSLSLFFFFYLLFFFQCYIALVDDFARANNNQLLSDMT